MNTGKLVSMLTETALFFTPCDQLDDKFEASLTQHAQRQHQASWRGVLASAPSVSLARRAYDACSDARRALRRQRAVSCWHMQPYESEIMWKRYALNGVAVKSTVGRLVECFPTPERHDLRVDERWRVHVRAVEYLDYDADPMHTPSVLTKRIEFRAERELRAVIRSDDPRGHRRDRSDTLFRVWRTHSQRIALVQ